MRTRLRVMLILLTLICASAMMVLAQNVPSAATWPCLTDASVQNSGRVTGTPQFITSNLVYGSYAAVGTNFYTQRIKMNAWPAAQLTQLDTVYIQFSIAPHASYTMRVDSVVLSIGAVSTQDMMANLYYSKDSTFATKTLVSYRTSVAARVGKPAGVFLNAAKLDTVSFPPNLTVNAGERFFFRINPWVDSSSSVTGKYIAVQTVIVYATASPIPVVAAATWPLASNGTAVVSGLVSGATIAYDNVNLYHYGYNTNGDRWTNHLPSDGAWPAETSPNFSRYAQFSIAPQLGGAFISDSLSFTQIVEFTNNLRIAIYYSDDSTFAARTFIADTTVPSAKTPYTYALKDTAGSGNAMYVRFYPYDITGDPSYKLVDMSNVTISGTTTGLAILAPTITTTAASNISTTFLASGGTVTADGGSPVIARGVCWDTAASPTTAKNHTTDGSGIGSFTSAVNSLAAGLTYHIRAYATNVAGTTYGNEIAPTTLAMIVAPSVATTAISSILVKRWPGRRG